MKMTDETKHKRDLLVLDAVRRPQRTFKKSDQMQYPRTVEMARLIYFFGGSKKIAKICGVSSQCVYRWRTHVTPEAAWRLLAYARRHNINDITLEWLRPDLDFGIKKDEVETL